MNRDGWVVENAPVFTRTGRLVYVRLARHVCAFEFNDPWGVGARSAWAREDWHGKKVACLGVGCAAEAVQALRNGQVPLKLLLNDIVPVILDIGVYNTIEKVTELGLRTQVVVAPGPAEQILRQPKFAGPYDLILGCLPQVPANGQLDDTEIAHMYSGRVYPEMAKWGLGLLYAVLEASRACLKPEGHISLVVSGRIPWSAVEQLFAATGFRPPWLAYQFMVRHHLGTPLTYLNGLDGAGILFRDQEGREPVSPETAEEERLAVERGEIAEADFKVHHWVRILNSSPQ